MTPHSWANCRSARQLDLQPSALTLLREAHRRLREAREFEDPLDRYAAAHVAALRAAAAVLAVRGSPTPDSPRRRRPRNAWILLTEAAPELEEWAVFFALGAVKRAAAEAGVSGAATAAEADALVLDVESFLAVVTTTLGFAARVAVG